MEPEHPEHDETGGKTQELGAQRAGDDSAGGLERPDAPWPRFEELASGRPAVPADDDDDLDGGIGLPTLTLALLLGAVGLVAFGGIAIGKAVEPSSKTTTSVVAPGAATTVPTPTTPPPTGVRAHPRPVTTRWGPLTVHASAHFKPSARAAATVSGTTLVIAGGSGDRVLAGPVGGPLSRIAALPGKEAAAQAFAIGGAVYVLGGEQGATPSAQVTRVDVSGAKAALVGSFEEPLAEAGAAVSGSSVLLVGGWTGQKYATAVLRYSPGGSASLVARLPEGVRSPAVAVVGHTLVVAGGLTQHGVSRQVYAIDLTSGGLKALAALPTGLDRAALLEVGSRLYLFGGLDGAGKPLASIVRIDVARGVATVAGSMPRPLVDAVAARAGSQALLVDTRGGVVYRLG